MPVYAALVTAAGSSTRMGGHQKKEYFPARGKPLILHALEAFEKTGIVSLYVITVPPGGEDEARAVLSPWLARRESRAQTLFVFGGDTRQKSVYQGLRALASYNPGIVLIHDGARPWVTPELILAVAGGAQSHGACLPLTPAVDALKKINAAGFVELHLDRGQIRGAQTPQGFIYSRILEAHTQAASDGHLYMDDTEIYAAYEGPVFSVPGDEENKKITYPSDLQNLPKTENTDAPGPKTGVPRVGFGYDLHRLTEGRRLLLGGVDIPFSKGEDGHSDGDVLIHAVIDALFGAAGLGDIGSRFPPSDPAYKDISSRILLRRAAELVRGENLRIGNLDCTIVLEMPKILPYRQAITSRLAEDLGIPPAVVSVKGKTKEKADATGEGRAVEAFATVLLV